MPWYGIAHVFSLVYLTFVVALVIGLHEVEEPQQARRHVLGCWARLLGSLVGMMLVVYILSLFSGG
ncbi:MAG TPA: hypothetical protein PLA90_17990 [Candidatus Sumerlaeota bacterium]|jgi:hypothetical protein|nr:hypothetical protein [Candidatus Sumerlaeota bacterium]HPS03433.1 hypothetical protein [Candidatus Sumerlaeota bacterium]